MTADPYRIWLGIPKGVKNPNYYHILGIDQGESNDEVIRSAIEQRRFYIQSKRGQGDAAAVKQILDLIEEAAATLLVPEFKHGYDRQMGIHHKGRRRTKAMLLPPWMESRIVRVYGEGSGLLAEVLGIVAILFGAFALMAWFSFQLPWQKIPKDDDAVADATPLEKIFGESSAAKTGSDPSESPQATDSNESKSSDSNSGSLMAADQVVGSWREARANTPVGDRVRTFHANGTFTIKMPKLGKSFNGAWRRSGNKVYFNHPEDDGSTPVEDKSFEIVKVDDRLMVILMDGKRTYEWTRVDSTENSIPHGDSFESLASQSTSTPAKSPGQSSIQSQLQGKWKCVSEFGLSDSQLRDMKKQLEIVGNRFKISRKKNGELGVYDGEFRLSNSNEFDWTGTTPDGSRKDLVGVYSWDQTSLKICYRLGEQGTNVQRANWSDQGSKAVVCAEFIRDVGNFESQASSQANKPSSQASQSQVGSIPKPVLYLSGESIPTSVKMIRQDGDFVAGRIGKAVAFNGRQMSELDIALPIGKAPRTLACWIKSNRGPTKEMSHVVNFGPHEKTKPFGIMEAGGKWRFFDFNGGLDSEQAVDKNWHHHAVTYDGSLITYYFDSSKVAATERVLSTERGSLMIGGINGHSHFDGIVDELYFFDSALSAGQVRSLFQLKDAK